METKELFDIPDKLGVYSALSIIYNDNEELQTAVPAETLFDCFHDGTLPEKWYIMYLQKVFDEYHSGNKAPFNGLIKKIKSDKIKLPGTLSLFVDTETSGVSSYDKVIQLAYVVKYYPWIAAPSITLDTYCEYIKEEVSINKHAIKVHGVTKKILEVYGVDKKIVYKRYIKMSQLCKYVYAFNAPFDKRMIENSIPTELTSNKKYAYSPNWKCVMKMAKNKGHNGKLCDLYKKFTGGNDIENAHDALADTRAMIVVFDGIHSE